MPHAYGTLLLLPLGLTSRRGSRQPRVRLVALDMDGTLLNSASKVEPASAAVIRAAAAAGVNVILATGKARPAALAACREARLEGDDLLCSHRRPGVFLQVRCGTAAGWGPELSPASQVTLLVLSLLPPVPPGPCRAWPQGPAAL